MRQFSTNATAALAEDYVDFFILIKLEFGTTHYYTSLPYDLTYDGQTWSSDGGLFEYDPPSTSSVIDREAYRIAVADVSGTMQAEIASNVIGAPMSVFGGFLDASGAPLLGSDDVFLIYKGTVDAPTITNDFEQRLAVFEGTSPMSDLDMVRTLITSKDGMDQYSATDTSFDEVFEDAEINLKWGKK
jgi:hypothetical protein